MNVQRSVLSIAYAVRHGIEAVGHDDRPKAEAGGFMCDKLHTLEKLEPRLRYSRSMPAFLLDGKVPLAIFSGLENPC